MFKPHKASTSGSAATEMVESRSLIIETVRRLNRSIAAPAKIPTTQEAAAVTPTTRPAAEISPVLARISSGNITVAIPLLSRDNA